MSPYSPNLIQTHSATDLLPIHKINPQSIHKINPQWSVSPGWDSSACAAVCTILRLHCYKFKTQKNKQKWSVICSFSSSPGILWSFPSPCNLQFFWCNSWTDIVVTFNKWTVTVVTSTEWPDPCPDVSRALGPHLAGSSPSTDHGLGCEQTSWGPLPLNITIYH